MIRFCIPVLSLGLYMSFAAFNSRHVALSEIALWSLFALTVGIIAMLISWRVSKNIVLQVIVGYIMLVGFYSFGYLFRSSGEVPITVQVLQVLYVGLIPISIYAIRRWQPSKIWKPFLIVFAITVIIYPSTMVVIPPKVDTNTLATTNSQQALDRSIFIVVLDRYTIQ